MVVTSILRSDYVERFSLFMCMMGTSCTKRSSADRGDSEVYRPTVQTTSMATGLKNLEDDKCVKGELKKQKVNHYTRDPCSPSTSTSHSLQIKPVRTPENVLKATNDPTQRRTTSPAMVPHQEIVGTDIMYSPLSPHVRNEHMMVGVNDDAGHRHVMERVGHGDMPGMVIHSPHHAGLAHPSSGHPHSGHSHHRQRQDSGSKKGQTGNKQNKKLDFIDRLVLETLQLIRTLVEK